MPNTNDNAARLAAFLAKWQASGAAERANAQLFLNELCGILDVEMPHGSKPDEALNTYVFEKAVPSPTGSTWRADLYKRGCFVLETKQGADLDESTTFSAEAEERKKRLKTGHGVRGTKGWDVAMQRAKEQAERYARALPREEVLEGRPPFVVVVDVGHSIALYTDWSRMGGDYVPFPDPATYRIPLKDLERAEVQERLRSVWSDPVSLDPSRRSAKVTREIADRLAKLARSLEGMRPPEEVGSFLMRCLFTMFSEDVDLIPHGSFTGLLSKLKQDPSTFAPMLENLWGTMNTGGLSPILFKKLPRFNGGLFADAKAIPLEADQIQLLIEASTANWKDVEPAIFGTLLERALDPRERHKLGAHYTPRAYVERLVNPTVIEPLREQWKSVQVAALQLAEDGELEKARKQVEGFLHQLATVKVLDPACGSGNFLYVTLELLKRLEGEVVNTLHDLGATSKLELEGVMVTPANFYGIELNPRAAGIAEQVLWIGFLQWHLRTHGNLHNLPEPIIKDLHNIECRDAVLESDGRIEQRDANGERVTRWDGRTTKQHPVTGEEVPDPEARVPVYTYTNPRPANWPTVDYIVGNPPFIGNKRMRAALGDGYASALREAWDGIPDTVDFVMYWWDKAAELVRTGKAKRFGFIATNSLRQTFNRKVLQYHLGQRKPLSLVFAIADHPWVDSLDGAAVRVSMTVGMPGKHLGVLQEILTESDSRTEDSPEVTLSRKIGRIHPDLSVGSDVVGALKLQANDDVCFQGFVLVGEGFLLTEEERSQILAVEPLALHVIRRWKNGKDLLQKDSCRYVIDLFGMEVQQVIQHYPVVYQHLLNTVKPFRDQVARKGHREKWWIWGEARPGMRRASAGLRRVVVTNFAAKHRLFMYADAKVALDHNLYVIATEDAFFLGVLSSRFHVTWMLAAGSTLEDRPLWINSTCFRPFPFPECTPEQQAKIRDLAEELDGHRKRQQALHPELTLTGIYNVLEAVRSGEPLSVKDRAVYEAGLVGILKELHDKLDAAVAEAYGWPADLSTDEILQRLVDLNAERAAEEARGLVRWLRPEYQAKGQATDQGTQAAMEVDQDAPAPAPVELATWPAELPAQAAALSGVLAALAEPNTVDAIASRFEGKRTKKRLEEMARLLETLAVMGRAQKLEGERWQRLS